MATSAFPFMGMFGSKQPFNAQSFNTDLIPGANGPLSAQQLDNLGNNNFGMQANANGQQNFLQDFLFKEPTFGANGAGAPGGLDFGNISGLLSGIGDVTQIFAALKGLKMAEEQFGTQQKNWQKNFTNSTKAYNTSLEDRTRARFHTEGRSDEVGQYVDEHSLRA